MCVELNGALQRLFLCNIANVTEGTFEIVQKSRSRKHGDIINYRKSGFFAGIYFRVFNVRRVKFSMPGTTDEN